MVSFQCDACQDIVKKPKLDQHHGRGCGASFTCIDCSQTFAAPVDWKAHTSCISEAQKYQKALYRPKTTSSSAGMDRAASSTGKFHGRQGTAWARPPLGRPRFQPTGANGTPLGTPTRMSPVTIPAQANDAKCPATTTPAETTEPATGKGKKSSKKRKLDEGNPAATEVREPDTSVQQNGQNATEKDNKDKKESKKRKEKRKEAAEAIVVDAPTDRTHALQDDTLPSSSATVNAKSRGVEKSKNKKKEGLQTQTPSVRDETVDEIATGFDSTRNGDDDKEKKKRKRKTALDATAQAAAGDGDGSSSGAAAATQSDKLKKTKRKRAAEEEMVEEADGEAENKKSKKKKKISNV